MLRLAFAAALLLLGVPGRAHANPATCEGFSHCSKILYAQGKCDGQDHTPIWLTPWETKPIRILGVNIGFDLQGGEGNDRHGYVHVGNSYHPDIMASLMFGSPMVPFPPGFYFEFPALTASTPDPFYAPHIDAHVQCSGADNYRAWVLLFYELVPAAIATAATQ